MNQPPLPGLALASLFMAAVTAILAAVFAWRYSRVTWRRTGEGRHWMRFAWVVCLTYGLTVLTYFLPIPILWLVWVQLGLFSWAAGEMWTRNVLFTEAQRNPLPCPCPHHKPHGEDQSLHD